MSLRDTLSQHWLSFQHELFPWLAEELGPLSERHKRLVQVPEFVCVEELLPGTRGSAAGRPPESRATLARAFLAKAVFAVPTRRALVERLRNDPALRRLCGWEKVGAVPSEATFSRACAAFAKSGLPGRLHEALVERTLQGHLAGHVSCDSTAIAVRQQPVCKSRPAKQKRKRARPRKGEQRAPQPTRLQRQFASAAEGWLEGVRALLEAGADPNAVSADIDRERGVLWPALHTAAAKGHAGVVRALLGAGAAHDALTNEGETALQLARSRDHHSCVAVLEEAARGEMSH